MALPDYHKSNTIKSNLKSENKRDMKLTNPQSQSHNVHVYTAICFLACTIQYECTYFYYTTGTVTEIHILSIWRNTKHN